MEYWTEYQGHIPDIQGKRKKFDNTVYTFDIETTSYLILNNKSWNYYYTYKINKLCKQTLLLDESKSNHFELFGHIALLCSRLKEINEI